MKKATFKYVDNKKTLTFKYYKVIQESNNHYAIYRNHCDARYAFLTHKTSWSAATRLAKLLNNEAGLFYSIGYDYCRDDDWHRYSI